LQLSRKIWYVILGGFFFRFVLGFLTPLTPQEAYYWSWSLSPDWSYFDHPPLATYTIWLTTHLLGTHTWSIKLAANLWYLLFYVLVARLFLRLLRDEALVFYSLLFFQLTVVYELYGFVISPDSPLLALWVAVVYLSWRAWESDSAWHWYLVGAVLGLSWMAKYTAVLLAPSIFLFLLLTPRGRRWLKTPHPYLALIVAVAVFSPVLFWNWQHEWISFTFQSARRVHGMGGWHPRFFGELLGSQFFMLTPYGFWLVIWLLVKLPAWYRRNRLEAAQWLLLSSGLPLLILFTLVSFRSLVKMNWLVPAYWSLLPLALGQRIIRGNPTWKFKFGSLSSGIFFGLALLVVLLPNVPLGDGNTWSGWRQAAQRIDHLKTELEQQGQQVFIFSNNYKVASLLRFYLPGHPQTFAQNIYGRPALQFDLWPPRDPLQGATGILVVDDRREYRLDWKDVRPFFERIEPADSLEIIGFGRHTRRITWYLARGYRGYPYRSHLSLQGLGPW